MGPMDERTVVGRKAGRAYRPVLGRSVGPGTASLFASRYLSNASLRSMASPPLRVMRARNTSGLALALIGCTEPSPNAAQKRPASVGPARFGSGAPGSNRMSSGLVHGTAGPASARRQVFEVPSCTETCPSDTLPLSAKKADGFTPGLL